VAALAALTAATLLAGLWRAGAGNRGWRRDAAETGLLWLYFLVVPPLVAVGVYFCVWHSLRHAVRLVGIDERARGALLDRGPLAALAHTGRDAAPLTAVSLLLLVGLGAVAGLGSIPDLAALYLVFVAVLTLPHVVVVSWMDRAERAGLARINR
jgi:Brp/Blh family beta-carotene 15,15'-monooxygenase